MLYSGLWVCRKWAGGVAVEAWILWNFAILNHSQYMGQTFQKNLYYLHWSTLATNVSLQAWSVESLFQHPTFSLWYCSWPMSPLDNRSCDVMEWYILQCCPTNVSLAIWVVHAVTLTLCIMCGWWFDFCCWPFDQLFCFHQHFLLALPEQVYITI